MQVRSPGPACPRAGNCWQRSYLALAFCTGFPYIKTHAHSHRDPDLQKQASKLWDDAERVEFIEWIAANPTAGDVIPGAEGARKVRWSRAGSGKSGGARVIYFNLTDEEVVLLVAVYAKADRSSMSPAEIKKVV